MDDYVRVGKTKQVFDINGMPLTLIIDESWKDGTLLNANLDCFSIGEALIVIQRGPSYFLCNSDTKLTLLEKLKCDLSK